MLAAVGTERDFPFFFYQLLWLKEREQLSLLNFFRVQLLLYCWKSAPVLMVVRWGKDAVLESVACFNSLFNSFRPLYPWRWHECPGEVSWHWCAHWGWCCDSRRFASHLVCWLSQGDLRHRADLWPQLVMTLLCLLHPSWGAQASRGADLCDWLYLSSDGRCGLLMAIPKPEAGM